MKKYEIRENNTFEIIKKGDLNILNKFKNIEDAILYSKNAIIIWERHYNIAYFEVDKNHNISKNILINICKNGKFILKDIIFRASLKLLKNKKICIYRNF